MSVVYDSFGSLPPEPDAATARARIEWQDGYLRSVVEPAVANLAFNVESQEDALRSVYRPLVRQLGRAISQNGTELSLIDSALHAGVGSRIADQAGQLAGVRSVAIGATPTPSAGPADVPLPGDRESPTAGGAGCGGYFDPAYCPPEYQYWCLVYLTPGLQDRPEFRQRLLRVRYWTPSGWFYPGPDLSVTGVKESHGPFATSAEASALCAGLPPPGGEGGGGGVGGDDTVVGGGDDDVTDDDTDDDDDDRPPPECQPVKICEPVEVRILKDKEDDKKDDNKDEEEKEDEEGREFEEWGFDAAEGVDVPQVMPADEWDVGHPRICTTVTVYLRSFYKIGTVLSRLLPGESQSNADLIRGMTDALRGIPGFGKPLAKILELSTPDTEKVSKAVIEEARKVFSKAQTELLLGLHFARAVISTLEQVQVGINFAVWITVTANVQLHKWIEIVDYLIEYVKPARPVDVGEVASLVLSDEITPTHAACLTRLSGHTEDTLERIVRSRRARPSDQLLLSDYNRDRTSVDALRKKLRNNGWTDPAEQDVVIRSADFLPPPSDAIRFAVKDVFDPNKLGLREMRKEFEDQRGLKEMLDANGIRPTWVRTASGARVLLDVPFYYWVASYEEVSPTQVFEMLHRLRPERVQKWAVPGSNGQKIIPRPVTFKEVNALLKEKDYNPIWRDRLAAISYRIPTRVDVRRIYRSGGFGPARGVGGFDLRDQRNPIPVGEAERELAAINQDLGYSAEDANRLAYWTAKDASEAGNSAQDRKELSLICRAYSSGQLSLEQAVENAERILKDKDRAIRQMGLCDVEMRVKIGEAVVKSTRSLYLKLVVDANGARQILTREGISNARINDLLRLWQLELAGKRREVTASSLCQWRESGVISDAEHVTRLSRLGYTPLDIDRIVRHCRTGILAKGHKEVTRRLAAQQRIAEKSAKIAEQRAAKREAVVEKARKAALSARSDANLKRWLDLGVMDENEAAESLRQRGWLLADINRWLIAYRASKADSEGQGA